MVLIGVVSSSGQSSHLAFCLIELIPQLLYISIGPLPRASSYSPLTFWPLCLHNASSSLAAEPGRCSSPVVLHQTLKLDASTQSSSNAGTNGYDQVLRSAGCSVVSPLFDPVLAMDHCYNYSFGRQSLQHFFHGLLSVNAQKIFFLIRASPLLLGLLRLRWKSKWGWCSGSRCWHCLRH